MAPAWATTTGRWLWCARPGTTSLDGVTVAIPGTLTTAFLALRLYKPDVQYVVMPFDEILEGCATARSRRAC